MPDTPLNMISAKERGISISRSRHTEAQMIAALKQGERWGDSAREVGVHPIAACRHQESIGLTRAEILAASRVIRWD